VTRPERPPSQASEPARDARPSPATLDRVATAARPWFAPDRIPPSPAAWQLVLATAVGTALVLLRVRPLTALDTLWAEDGRVFLQQAVERGALDPTLELYAGYVHLVPRLSAALAAVLPLRLAGIVLTVVAALAVALLAVFVYVAAAGVIPSRVARGLLAFSLLVLPVGREEVVANVANLHWFLMFAAAWALLWPVGGRPRSGTAATAVVFLAAASDPITVLLLPLAALRWVAAPPGFTRTAPLVGLVAGLGLQAVTIVFGDGAGGPERELAAIGDLPRDLAWFVLRVPGRLLLGDRIGEAIGIPPNAAAAAAALLVVALLAVVVVRVWRTTTRWPVLGLLGLAGAFYLFPVMLTGTATPRYGVVPAMLLLSAVAVALTRPGVVPTHRGRRIALTLSCLVVAVWVVDLGVVNERATTPRFGDQVDEAATEPCEDPGDLAVLEIAPPGWIVEVACEDLEGA
jgi:hypothetical protein